MIKKPLIIPFLITLIFSTFSPITIHSANAATVVNGSCIATVSSDVGVTVSVIDSYCVVSFTSTAAAITWSVPAGVTSADVLVVGGGGAGGAGIGGGGGAGQFINSTAVSVSGTITVSVGAGGTGTTGGGNAGSNSVFGSTTAAGGGGGGFNDATAPTASSNGSGGGGGFGVSGRATTGAAGTATSGGNGSSGSCNTATSGGGGGAGGVGVSGTSISGGAGGAGSSSSITGSPVTYAGGGGGGINGGAGTGNCITTGLAGSGGSGVGGAGGTKVSPYGGSSGSANTGSGGGGGSNTIASATGGAGGSGIVVVKYFAITIPQISHKLKERGSFTMDTATVSSGFATYGYSGTSNCTGTTSGRTITVSFSTSGTCIITATASSFPDRKALTTFDIVPNITQKLISRTGIQPNALSSYIPPPYLSTSETYTVTSCVSIVGATGADLLSSTNLSFSLASLLVSPGVITDTGAGKSYTITGTLAQVQAAFSIFKLNSSSGRIMAANSGSIYLRARTNLVVDSATDTGCIDYNDARITLYQYTSDQVRRKNVPQKSGSTP